MNAPNADEGMPNTLGEERLDALVNGLTSLGNECQQRDDLPRSEQFFISATKIRELQYIHLTQEKDNITNAILNERYNHTQNLLRQEKAHELKMECLKLMKMGTKAYIQEQLSWNDKEIHRHRCAGVSVRDWNPHPDEDMRNDLGKDIARQGWRRQKVSAFNRGPRKDTHRSFVNKKHSEAIDTRRTKGDSYFFKALRYSFPNWHHDVETDYYVLLGDGEKENEVNWPFLYSNGWRWPSNKDCNERGYGPWPFERINAASANDESSGIPHGMPEETEKSDLHPATSTICTKTERGEIGAPVVGRASRIPRRVPEGSAKSDVEIATSRVCSKTEADGNSGLTPKISGNATVPPLCAASKPCAGAGIQAEAATKPSDDAGVQAKTATHIRQDACRYCGTIHELEESTSRLGVILCNNCWRDNDIESRRIPVCLDCGSYDQLSEDISSKGCFYCSNCWRTWRDEIKAATSEANCMTCKSAEDLIEDQLNKGTFYCVNCWEEYDKATHTNSLMQPRLVEREIEALRRRLGKIKLQNRQEISMIKSRNDEEQRLLASILESDVALLKAQREMQSKILDNCTGTKRLWCNRRRQL